MPRQEAAPFRRFERGDDQTSRGKLRRLLLPQGRDFAPSPWTPLSNVPARKASHSAAAATARSVRTPPSRGFGRLDSAHALSPVAAGRPRRFQPRLWLILIGLLAMFLYLLAFISMNGDRIKIDFVFFTATVSLIWAMVLMVAFGCPRRRAAVAGLPQAPRTKPPPGA